MHTHLCTYVNIYVHVFIYIYDKVEAIYEPSIVRSLRPLCFDLSTLFFHSF